MTSRTFCLFAALLICGVARAQSEDPAAADAGPWSGNVKLGYLATSGNTENSNLNTSFEIGYARGLWKHVLDGYAINASENQATTSEAYGVGWKSERSLSEHNFLFGRVNWRKDLFSGYPEQLSESVGYGRRLIDAAPHTLNAEIGAGARQSTRADGTTENDGILRGGLDYRWAFSETAEFTQDLVLEYGRNNTYLESVSAVKARLIGDFALVASYTVKNNSDVPVGTENTDTYTAVSLEYQF